MAYMKKIKKTRTLFFLVSFVLLASVFVLTGCTKNTVDLSSGLNEPTHFVAKFILLLNDSIGSFGWTVVAFTVILKLILSPLDFWQKLITRKNAKKMKRMKPQLDKLKEKCGDDKARFQQEQMALFKKEKYSTVGACLPSLVTLVVFFVIFAGFSQMIAYKNAESFVKAQTIFNNSKEINFNIEKDKVSQELYKKNFAELNIEEQIAKVKAVANKKAISTAQSEVKEKYEQEGFLWIKNVFVPDSWKPAVPEYASFTGQSGFAQARVSGIDVKTYEEVMGKVLGTRGYGKNGSWNGLLLLPLLSIALNFLSQWLMTKAQGMNPATATASKSKDGKKGADSMQGMTKAMQYMMPLMMGIFAILYSSAFTIYIFTNALMTILFQLLFNLGGYIVDKKNGDLPPKAPKKVRKVKKA